MSCRPIRALRDTRLYLLQQPSLRCKCAMVPNTLSREGWSKQRLVITELVLVVSPKVHALAQCAVEKRGTPNDGRKTASVLWSDRRRHKALSFPALFNQICGNGHGRHCKRRSVSKLKLSKWIMSTINIARPGRQWKELIRKLILV